MTLTNGNKIYVGNIHVDLLDDEFKNPKVHIGIGKPEWGAKPDKRYLVITWDEE